MSKDRRSALIQSTVLNGIDFVEVASPDQKTLRVHFLNPVALAGAFDESKVKIEGGETIPRIAVLPIANADWSTDGDGNPVLTLRVAAPGDFSVYTLSIESAKLDSPYFSQARFSFKALCETTLDCKAPETDCPAPSGELPPIDYLAKDFRSFKQALSEFSALRYPDWAERSEADFGVMMMEALSALADDLSYTQDRIAAESSIETATERRSLVRHARLVDYEPTPATSARVTLRFEVGSPVTIPAGTLVTAAGPDGAVIPFEAGEELGQTAGYDTDPRWNNLTPYFFDDGAACLKAGATSMWVEGKNLGLSGGQLLVIETDGTTSADPPIRQFVRLVAGTPTEEGTDQIFSKDFTKITWRAEDALEADRDLSKTRLQGNLLPATQGRRCSESFAIETPPPALAELPRAIYRQGPDGAPVYLHSLSQSQPTSPLTSMASSAGGLAWLRRDDGSLRPEIDVMESRPLSTPVRWSWMRWLLDARAFDPAFTIDAAYYRRIAANSDGSVQMEYDGGQGDTIRFGDGVFGDIPEKESTFTVTYRVGIGRGGNVAPDAPWRLESPGLPVISVHNPFAATGGADAETPLSIERQAPEAFRAVQYRAVLRQDYEQAAQTLPWVQRAGTTFRWTGSWMTGFTAPDPKGSARLGVDQHIELVKLLNRYRLAGYESYVPHPRYAALDLRIRVCARADSFRGDVHAAILQALSVDAFPDGTTGFFHPDRFTFGRPLSRSELEAAIQDARGVGGVISIQYRRRAFTPGFVPMPMLVAVGSDEIVLVQNDPSRPEAGSIQITVEGGK